MTKLSLSTLFAKNLSWARISISIGAKTSVKNVLIGTSLHETAFELEQNPHL